MWRGDIRAARVVAGTELRATYRRLTRSRRQQIVFGFALLQFLVVFPAWLFGPATSLGRQLATGRPPSGTLGVVCTNAALAGGYMGAATAINQNRLGTVGPLVRTSVPPRAVTMGRFGSELVQTGYLFVPLLLVVLSAVAVGAGGPVVPLLLGVAVLTILLWGVLAGRLLGAVIRYLGLLSRLSTWSKIAVLLAGTAAIVLGSQVAFRTFLAGGTLAGSQALGSILPGRPFQAYAETLLAPLGSPPRPLGIVAVLAVLLSIPVCLAATVRIETAMLLTADDSEVTDETTTRTVPSLLSYTQSTRIAWHHLLRTVRDPKSLAHVFPLLVGILPVSVSWLTDPGILLTAGPPGLVGLGTLLSGLTYCLNPLGDDRDQLPLLLTSVSSPTPLLRGRMVAGGVFGVTLSGVGFALAPFGGEPAAGVAVAALGPVFVFAGAGTALGIGAFAPQFERREYMNVERAHPSQIVLLGYLFGGGLVFVGGSFGFWFLLAEALAGSVAPVVAGTLSLAGVAVLAGFGAGGYRYATGRFETLTLDDT